MSLRDQLLKSGVATKKQMQNVRSQKKAKNKKKAPSANNDARMDNLLKERVERDKKLNREKEEVLNKKALLAKIQQLVTTNAVARENGDAPYRFTHGKKVKTLHFSQVQVENIISGVLSIVALKEDDYYLVPRLVAEKISEQDSGFVLVNNRKNSDSKRQEDDDPYAEYEIPDDLVW